MNYLEIIEQKYKFSLPKEYCRLNDMKCFDLDEPKHYSKALNDPYLWLFELEWIHPSKILTFDCEDQIRERYVPFAFNGAGELWCWVPKETDENGTPIVLLDNIDSGTYEAPDFKSILFQQVLMFIQNQQDDMLIPYLNKYLLHFNEFFCERWQVEINKVIATGNDKISDNYFDITYQDMVGYSRYQESFQWYNG